MYSSNEPKSSPILSPEVQKLQSRISAMQQPIYGIILAEKKELGFKSNELVMAILEKACKSLEIVVDLNASECDEIKRTVTEYVADMLQIAVAEGELAYSDNQYFANVPEMNTTIALGQDFIPFDQLQETSLLASITPETFDQLKKSLYRNRGIKILFEQKVNEYTDTTRFQLREIEKAVLTALLNQHGLIEEELKKYPTNYMEIKKFIKKKIQHYLREEVRIEKLKIIETINRNNHFYQKNSTTPILERNEIEENYLQPQTTRQYQDTALAAMGKIFSRQDFASKLIDIINAEIMKLTEQDLESFKNRWVKKFAKNMGEQLDKLCEKNVVQRVSVKGSTTVLYCASNEAVTIGPDDVPPNQRRALSQRNIFAGKECQQSKNFPKWVILSGTFGEVSTVQRIFNEKANEKNLSKIVSLYALVQPQNRTKDKNEPGWFIMLRDEFYSTLLSEQSGINLSHLKFLSEEDETLLTQNVGTNLWKGPRALLTRSLISQEIEARSSAQRKQAIDKVFKAQTSEISTTLPHQEHTKAAQTIEANDALDSSTFANFVKGLGKSATPKLNKYILERKTFSVGDGPNNNEISSELNTSPPEEKNQDHEKTLQSTRTYGTDACDSPLNDFASFAERLDNTTDTPKPKNYLPAHTTLKQVVDNSIKKILSSLKRTSEKKSPVPPKKPKPTNIPVSEINTSQELEKNWYRSEKIRGRVIFLGTYEEMKIERDHIDVKARGKDIIQTGAIFFPVRLPMTNEENQQLTQLFNQRWAIFLNDELYDPLLSEQDKKLLDLPYLSKEEEDLLTQNFKVEFWGEKSSSQSTETPIINMEEEVKAPTPHQEKTLHSEVPSKLVENQVLFRRAPTPMLDGYIFSKKKWYHSKSFPGWVVFAGTYGQIDKERQYISGKAAASRISFENSLFAAVQPKNMTREKNESGWFIILRATLYDKLLAKRCKNDVSQLSHLSQKDEALLVNNFATNEWTGIRARLTKALINKERVERFQEQKKQSQSEENQMHTVLVNTIKLAIDDETKMQPKAMLTDADLQQREQKPSARVEGIEEKRKREEKKEDKSTNKLQKRQSEEEIPPVKKLEVEASLIKSSAPQIETTIEDVKQHANPLYRSPLKRFKSYIKKNITLPHRDTIAFDLVLDFLSNDIEDEDKHLTDLLNKAKQSSENSGKGILDTIKQYFAAYKYARKNKLYSAADQIATIIEWHIILLADFARENIDGHKKFYGGRTSLFSKPEKRLKSQPRCTYGFLLPLGNRSRISYDSQRQMFEEEFEKKSYTKVLSKDGTIEERIEHNITSKEYDEMNKSMAYYANILGSRYDQINIKELEAYIAGIEQSYQDAKSASQVEESNVDLKGMKSHRPAIKKPQRIELFQYKQEAEVRFPAEIKNEDRFKVKIEAKDLQAPEILDGMWKNKWKELNEKIKGQVILTKQEDHLVQSLKEIIMSKFKAELELTEEEADFAENFEELKNYSAQSTSISNGKSRA